MASSNTTENNGNAQLFFNESILGQMTGYSNHELCPGEVCSIEHMIFEEDMPRVIAEVKKAISNKRDFQIDYRVKTKEGRTKYFNERGKPIYDFDGTALYIDGVIFDITERRKSEKALAKSESHLKQIISSISHPFHVIDVKTRIIKHASKKTGQVVVGKTCFLATHNSQVPCNSEEHPCPVDTILKTKKPTVVTHIHQRSDGSEKLVEIHASPLFDENGEVEYIIESNIDLPRNK